MTNRELVGDEAGIVESTCTKCNEYESECLCTNPAGRPGVMGFTR